MHITGVKQFDFVNLDVSGEAEALEDKSTRWAATPAYLNHQKRGGL